MDKKQKFRIIIILAIMGFFANGDNTAVTPLLGDIANELNVTETQAALSVSVYMLMFGICTIFIGPLAEKMGKTKVVNIAAFGTATFSILGGFAFNLPSLMFCRAVNGAFGAGIFPVTMAFTGEISDDEDRKSNLSLVLMIMTLGGALSLVIGGFFASIASWRLVYIFYGVAEMIMAILMYKFLPKISGSGKKVSFIDTYKEAFAIKKLLFTVLIIFLVGFSVYGPFAYSGVVLQSRAHVSVFVSGIVLTSFGIGNICASIYERRVSFKNKSAHYTSIAFISTLGFLMTMFGQTVYIFGLGLFIIGFAFVIIQSNLVENAQNCLPEKRAVAMSLVSFCIFGGGAFGTTINGSIINNFSFMYMYPLSIIGIIIVGVVAPIIIFRK